MTREQVLNEYETSDGRITSPGKFEGEPIFAPALWEIGLDGCADTYTREGYGFNRITKNDPLRKEWPELNEWLGRRQSITLCQDSQGFVHCR